MLRRPEGATIAEIVAATGWQPHSVRGVLAGALKKRLGLTIASEMGWMPLSPQRRRNAPSL